MGGRYADIPRQPNKHNDLRLGFMELLLQPNKVGISVTALINRIEEQYLVEFFGDEYVDYRKRVGTWIPFIQ